MFDCAGGTGKEGDEDVERLRDGLCMTRQIIAAGWAEEVVEVGLERTEVLCPFVLCED